MHKTIKNVLVLIAFSAATISAQDKGGKEKVSAPDPIKEKVAPATEVTEKTTTMSEKASPADEAKDIDLAKQMPHLKASNNFKISAEMKALLNEKKLTLKELNNADFEMNKLITKSMNWDKERNTEKKGQLDTILDKADRLAFSNELRMKLSGQAKTISQIIKKLNDLEFKVKEQEVADEKKRQMEAYIKHIEILKKERKTLIEKLKNQNSQTVVVNSTQAIQKRSEENVEYFTITEDTNLQTIALQYYQDHEKWTIIFEHPDNKAVLKKKSPTAIIPIGSVLTIPKLKEE